MAATSVEVRVLLSRICCALFAAAAAAAAGAARRYPLFSHSSAFSYSRLALCLQIVWCLLASSIQTAHQILGLGPMPNALLCILVGADWALVCFTWGTAWAALGVAWFARHSSLCTATPCTWYLTSAALAWVAGVLSTVTAMGTTWLLGSRFRRAQD